MKGAFKLGSISGIGIFIHWSFSLLIAYIVYSNYKNGQNTSEILWSVLFVLSIFMTVLLHELGHALAAKRYNINTKRITLLPIGGLAELETIPEKPMEELVVALAGPLVNLGFAFLTSLIIEFPSLENMASMLTGVINSQNFLLNFFLVNLWLVLFNLIPAFPMDGGRVLRALLAFKLRREKATLIAARIGQFIAIIFIFIGFSSSPALILIGIFILIGAQSEATYTKTKSTLSHYTVRDVSMGEIKTINSSETVNTAVQMLLQGQSTYFLILENEQPIGTLSRDEIISGLSEHGGNVAIQTVMNKEIVFLESNTPLEEAYRKLRESNTYLIVIVENQQMIGVLDNENILEFIMIREARKNKT
jgi:Zn-dependent protease/predicted transcriptional regulator